MNEALEIYRRMHSFKKGFCLSKTYGVLGYFPSLPEGFSRSEVL